MMDQPYSPFADGLSSARAWLAAFGDAGSGWGSAEGASLTALGDQPYSPFADWLSKFYLVSEPIQALWIVALSATVLGVTWIVMRGLREILSPHRHPSWVRLPVGRHRPDSDDPWSIVDHHSHGTHEWTRAFPGDETRFTVEPASEAKASTGLTGLDSASARRRL
jgi:hypothetical protein